MIGLGHHLAAGFLILALAPSPALAEDIAAMTPADLQSAAIAAVDAGNADTLMVLMKEIDRKSVV